MPKLKMDKAREEEDMEVDSGPPNVPDPLYRWRDYIYSESKLFDGRLEYHNTSLLHQWKITEVQYKPIKHFCSQEVAKLKLKSTSLYHDALKCYATDLSEAVKRAVRDIETKLSGIYCVEMNQAVTDELRYSSLLERLTTTNCLVCVPTYSSVRRIFIYFFSISDLCSTLEALCSEFERRKGKETNCRSSHKSDDVSTSVSSDYRHKKYLNSTLSPSTCSSVTNRKNDGIQIGSVKVKVYIGSILDAKVQAIVNAANKSLSFEAGVSRVIHNAAGYQFEEKCKALLRKNGSILKTSLCYPSDPGHLRNKFKWILHAVGPHWDDYEKKEECINLLANTVKNVMMSADSLGISSVAMPAISSGNSLVPIELCVLAYIIGIQQFGTGRTLREVHFVCKDQTVVDEMKIACSKYKKNPISITLETMKTIYPEYFQAIGEDTRNRKSTSNGNAQVAKTRPATLNIQPLLFKQRNIQVKVDVGSILDVNADVVVNAANEALSHGAGVAYVICSAAGKEFDEECQRELRIRGSLKTTEVLATRSGNLKKQFKYILNAVGPIWNQYPDKTQCLCDLHDTIVNILNEAENLHVRSLVMPAISSGIFGVPLKLCAEMYLQGIIDFSRQTALCLKEIHIVDIDVSVLREMTDAYYNYRKDPDSISIYGAKTRYPALMKALRSSSVFDTKMKNTNSSESKSYEQLHTEKLPQTKGRCLFKMKDEKYGLQTAKVFSFQNKMVIKIYTGSIVRFQGDALICSNDDGMSGIGPLAKAVAAAGGSKYNESYLKIKSKSRYGAYKWKLGDVETCSGGDLNVCFVVHAVIHSMLTTDQGSLKSYRTTLMNILYTINSYKNSTKFAMPLIGAGYLEERAEDLQQCCQTFFQALADFFNDPQSDCRIGELHLINRNPKVTHTLIDIFNCNSSQPLDTVENEQRSRHSSFTPSSRDENASTKSAFQRQHSWTNCTETRDEQPGGLRGVGARAKTFTGRSKSMFVRNPSAGATRFDKKKRASDTRDSGQLTKSSSSKGSQSMREETKDEKTKTSTPEGNLLIISDDDDDGRSHDETHVDDQRSYDETCPADVPSGAHSESNDDKTATCAICLDDVKDGMKLDCNHEFCKLCLTQSFAKHKKACPVCGKIFGEITGNQPPGEISFEKERRSLPGYEDCGTIVVKYNFKSGIQGPEHPKPDQPYEGTERRGFLPDNEEGRKVQRLLKKAFDRRLVFTIGYSRTTGKDNVVTWNDIHHKTKRDTGAQRFGYPDPTYLQRVQEELAAKGVTE